MRPTSIVALLGCLYYNSASAASPFEARGSLLRQYKLTSVSPLDRDHDIDAIETGVLKTLAVAPAGAVATTSSAPEAVSTLVGGFTTMLTLGSVYCWGNFISYLPPYLQYFSSTTTTGPSDALLVVPLSMCFQFIGMLLSPKIQASFGLQNTMLIGSLTMSLGCYLASYQTTLAPFLFFYSILFGTGIGMAYTSPLIMGFNWFPTRKGMVSGVVLAGFGLGGFFFNKIGSGFGNPLGLEAGSKAFEGVYDAFPTMLRKLSMVYVGMQVVGWALCKVPKGSKVGASPTVNGKGTTVGAALKTKEFWIIWSCIVLSATAGMNTVSTYKLFGMTNSALRNDAYLGLVGGLGACANGFGRTGWGIGLDKLGFKKLFVILTFAQSLIMLTMGQYTGNRVAYGAACMALFGCFGGNFAMAPGVCSRVFGEIGPRVYGYMFSAFGVAAIGGNALNKILLDAFGYKFVFNLMALMSALGGLLVTQLKLV